MVVRPRNYYSDYNKNNGWRQQGVGAIKVRLFKRQYGISGQILVSCCETHWLINSWFVVSTLKCLLTRGEYLRISGVGMRCLENTNWPIRLLNLDPCIYWWSNISTKALAKLTFILQKSLLIFWKCRENWQLNMSMTHLYITKVFKSGHSFTRGAKILPVFLIILIMMDFNMYVLIMIYRYVGQGMVVFSETKEFLAQMTSGYLKELLSREDLNQTSSEEEVRHDKDNSRASHHYWNRMAKA